MEHLHDVAGPAFGHELVDHRLEPRLAKKVLHGGLALAELVRDVLDVGAEGEGKGGPTVPGLLLVQLPHGIFDAHEAVVEDYSLVLLWFAAVHVIARSSEGELAREAGELKRSWRASSLKSVRGRWV